MKRKYNLIIFGESDWHKAKQIRTYKRQKLSILDMENDCEKHHNRKSSSMKLKCDGWSQQENKVFFILKATDPSIKYDQLTANFDSTSVELYFDGQLDWSCTFNEKIKNGVSDLLIDDDKVIVRLVKENPDIHWTDLTANRIPECDSNNRLANESLNAVSSIHKLNFVGNNFYEKDNEHMVLDVYLKAVNKETLDVQFCSREVTLTFSTSNAQFLEMHKASQDTVFQWSITVLDELDEEKCKYVATPSKVTITLHKKNPRHWGRLEAPFVAPSNKPTEHGWVSVNKNTNPITSPTNKMDDGGIGGGEGGLNDGGRNRSGVCFDEMSDPLTTATASAKPAADATHAQKPTCKVSPMNKQHNATSSALRHINTASSSSFKAATAAKGEGAEARADTPQVIIPPGFTGLDNLGNTCFMNSVVQVLVNTRLLKDYFLESHFQKDINTDNPLGTGGKLAVCFGVLNRTLWSGQHRSYAPHKLKNLVSMRNGQFTGFAQHDAQEFMAFLLDGLHEDLNKIQKKPYTEILEAGDRPEQEVADETWELHKKREDSFIVDHFQAQYKSKLVCPECSKVSVTFDPYTILPVPIPKEQQKISLIFLYKDTTKMPRKFVLQLSVDATIRDLKEALEEKTNIKAKCMRVFEAKDHRVYRFLNNTDFFPRISRGTLFVNEVLRESCTGEPVVHLIVMQRLLIPENNLVNCSNCHKRCGDGDSSKLRRCTRCYKAAYCDQSCQKDHWSKHSARCQYTPQLVGFPYIISMPKSQATYYNIARAAENSTRWSVSTFRPPVDSTQTLQNSDDTQQSASHSTTHDSTPGTTGEQQAMHTDVSSDSKAEDNADTSNTSTSNTDTSNTNTSNTSSDSDQSATTDVNSSTDSSQCGTDESTPSTTPTTPNRSIPIQYVMARPPVDVTPTAAQLFHLKPVTMHGSKLIGPGGQRLECKGEEPLDLTHNSYLSVDWKNNEKVTPYCMVQSKKQMDCEYDDTQELHVDENNTLQQCLSLFTEPEILNEDYAWYCPECKTKRQASKQLSLWTVPDILVIQLKRFFFKSLLWRDKIDKMITFPIRGLDMSPFLNSSDCELSSGAVYDLYGVINHHGSIMGGHYTSYARCTDRLNASLSDVDWRLFDDSHVTSVSERQVMTRDAYVLFYQRRTTIPSVSLPKAIHLDKPTDNPNKSSTRTGSATVTSTDQVDELQLSDGSESNEDSGHDDVTDQHTIASSYSLSYTDMDSVD